MRPSMTARRPGTGLLYLITSGLLWGTGGLTGSLLSRVAGLSAMSVAACRLTAGGVLIVIFLTVTGRRWPAGRAAWARIAMIGVLAALYQSCYFTAVALTSVALATLVTIGTAIALFFLSEPPDVVAEHHPDAILLDLRMPVLDGIGAIRRLTAEHPEVARATLWGERCT